MHYENGKFTFHCTMQILRRLLRDFRRPRPTASRDFLPEKNTLSFCAGLKIANGKPAHFARYLDALGFPELRTCGVPGHHVHAGACNTDRQVANGVYARMNTKRQWTAGSRAKTEPRSERASLRGRPTRRQSSWETISRNWQYAGRGRQDVRNGKCNSATLAQTGSFICRRVKSIPQPTFYII